MIPTKLYNKYVDFMVSSDKIWPKYPPKLIFKKTFIVKSFPTENGKNQFFGHFGKIMGNFKKKRGFLWQIIGFEHMLLWGKYFFYL